VGRRRGLVMRGKAGRFAQRAPFDPASLTGLTGWWDASDSSTLFDATTGGSLVDADGVVARIEDKSGAARHFTQGSSGIQPTRKTSQQNGLDVLRFDGSSDRMAGPVFNTLFTATASTCFVVAKASSVATDDSQLFANAVVLADTSGSHGFFAVRSNATVYSYGFDSGYSQASLSYTPGNWVCLTTDHDGVTLRVTANKTTSTTEFLSVRGFTNFSTILGANYDQTVFLDGDVGEVITYNVALGVGDREAVENYLMSKWGIS
jgi:hypothetical protein